MWIAPNSTDHVYCTDCIFFKPHDEELPTCVYADFCGFDDFEDSKPFSCRPEYFDKRFFENIQ